MSEPNKPESFLAELRRICGNARQVWHFVPRMHKLSLGGAAALMMVISGCNTAFPLLLGRLLDEIKIAAGHNLAAVEVYRIGIWYLGLIAAIYVVREGLQVLRRYLLENACTRIEKAMTVELFSHLIKVDLTAVGQEKIGALHGRMSRNVVGFVRFIRLMFLDLFPPVMTGIFAVAAAFSKQPLLSLAMVGAVPAALYLTVRQLRSQKGIRLEMIREREEFDGTVVEQLSGLDYVRAANTHDYEVRRVREAAERRRAIENRHHFEMSLFGCAKALNEGFFHILVLGVSAYLAVNGTISYGDILTFSFLFLNVMAPLNEVHRGLDEGHECSLLVADLLRTLEEPADRSFAPPCLPTPGTWNEPVVVSGQPILAVENLVVEYPFVEGSKRILNGISMVIKHGETIGLAGPSGCGKTTWLRVMLRLTHPTSGKVLLGGVPIESVSRDAIGRLIGYVGQSPFVFAGTIEDNIRYGSPASSAEAIRDAAMRACLHDEIMQMPGDYHALVRERGLNMSAGQRQRLALARIFLKDPPILILDEGTSALDTISERHIQRAIDLARKDRTIILVAHRLSTLMGADRIYVFQGGAITEAGTYAELYKKGGEFTELVKCASGPIEAGAVPAPSLARI